VEQPARIAGADGARPEGHDLHESVPYLYDNTVGDGPYNAWIDPILANEWQMMGWNNVAEMTKFGMPGVFTHGTFDTWSPSYLMFIAAMHNGISRLYETFGNGGADDGPPACSTCSSGQTLACYTGPPGTEGEGECRADLARVWAELNLGPQQIDLVAFGSLRGKLRQATAWGQQVVRLYGQHAQRAGYPAGPTFRNQYRV